MTEVVIKVDDLSKKYRLGNIGTGTLSRDLNQWWAKLRGKENPYAKLDEDGSVHFRNNEFWALQNLNFEVKKDKYLELLEKMELENLLY
ncbi:hypothetical protein [Adhaeribacter pallidiroseus]|uniref:Uncharacterized protein n=1 Tax=Adhaeribacter pallidiroseus TaxID=2072847 RepID=A0A369QS05_9BACT|nr:hypothetical protein [Adhaeribacter pallidiroseus]RDC66106.1 hypothetical protein AHMF7616_04737 [Adhaeribacter pallidiroseus]